MRLLLLTSFFAGAEVHAEPAAESPPSAQAASVIPPRPLSTPVEYPSDAEGDETVVLEMTVRGDGQLEDVDVISGSEPFASAAVQAVSSWRFEPALRDGEPIAVRVKFAVEFERPPPPPAPPETEAAPAAPPEAPRQPPSLEVLVEAARPPPGADAMTRAEARQLPGSFGDPLRAVEALPGVTPLVSGVPYFFVRGAPPGNVGFFIDDVPVPLLYHAFIGPSVVHPGMIERIELYRGGYPARYGRYAGAVVAADTRTPRSDFNGEASVRLIDAGALLEGGFADGRGSALVSGHYSYTGLILSLLSDATLAYWDYQARVAYDVTPTDRVSVFGFGAFDSFAAGDNTPDAQFEAGTQFHRIDLRYDSRVSRRTHARTALTLGYDRTGTQGGVLRDRSLRVRTQVEHTASAEVRVTVGADSVLDAYDLEADPLVAEYTDLQALFPPRDDLALGAFVDLELKLDPRVTLMPGIRADLYSSQGQSEVGVDPRVVAAFDVTPSVRIEHSFGIAHQRPSFIPQVPAAQVAGLRGGLQRSVQVASGARFALPADLTFSATVFRGAFFNVLDPIGNARDFEIDQTSATRRATGSSVGLELMLQRSLTRRLGGFVSYTLSRSERKEGPVESVSAFDRPHVLNLALAYDLGRRWRIGGRALYYTGIPALVFQAGAPRFTGDIRGDDFFRLDLRIEKRWQLGRTAWWALVGEVLNATGATEVVRLQCGARCAEPEISGPVILPSLGVEAAF
ncbi:MAG TPA: TonB-dependent receptor [Polyangiaceae bacterium]|nr:TonB-dependent receptor [Polyangiaceae bacterium]